MQTENDNAAPCLLANVDGESTIDVCMRSSSNSMDLVHKVDISRTPELVLN